MSDRDTPDMYEFTRLLADYIRQQQAYNAYYVAVPPTLFSMSDAEFLNTLEVRDDHGDNIFHSAMRFSTSEQFHFMIEKLERVVSRERIRQILITRDHDDRNLLQLAAGLNESRVVHRILWNVLKKYFDNSEILDMIKNSDVHGHCLLPILCVMNRKEILELTWNEIIDAFRKNQDAGMLEYFKSVTKKGENIFHLLMKINDVEKLIFLWKRLENCFNFHNSHHQFNELISQKESEYGRHVLHFAIIYDRIDFHEVLWGLLQKTFENREELKELIMQQENHGCNVVHLIISSCKADVIKFTFEKIKEVFSHDQKLYQEILSSKGEMGNNILKTATFESKDINIHKFLWKILKEAYKTKNQATFNLFACGAQNENNEEFLEILKDVGDKNCSIFHSAVCLSTAEIFEFMIKKLGKVASCEETRKILSKLTFQNRNIMQITAENKCVQMHESMWKVVHKYFTSTEIRDFIRHTDESGYNFLLCAAQQGTKEVVELAWNEISTVLGRGAGLTDYLKQCNDNNENIVFALMKGDDADKLTFLWRKLESHFKAQHLHHQFKELLYQKVQSNGLNALHSSAKSGKIEFHEALWKLLSNAFENREELKDLIMQQWGFDSNYIHALIACAKADVVELIFKTFKGVFSRDQLKEIFSSKGMSGKNVLNMAVFTSKDIKTHQLLWRIFQEHFNPSEFLNMIEEADNEGENLLFCAVANSPKGIAELTWNEIKVVFNKVEREQFTKYLKYVNNDGKNILHALISGNDERKLKFFCTELEKYFLARNMPEEMKHLVSQNSTKDNLNVLQTAASCDDVKFHEVLWELLLKIFTNREKLKDLLTHKSEQGNNFVHLAVSFAKTDMIEFTLKKIKEVFSLVQRKEILRAKGSLGRNLLHLAAVASKDVEVQRILWRTFREFCKSDEEFLEILKEVEDLNNNVIFIAAASSADIFNFMIKEVENIASREEVREILGTLGIENANVLQLAATKNQQLTAHENLWKIVHKYFNSAEIVDMIKHVDNPGNNLLIHVVEFNVLEIVELTWKEIKNALSDTDLIDYLGYVNRDGENIFHILIQRCEEEEFKFFCQQLENHPNKQELAQIFSQPTAKCRSILNIAAHREEIEFHETLWNFLLNTFENREELKNLIMQKEEDEVSFIHRLVNLNNPEIFEFTVKKIKQNLTFAREILISNSGELQKNVLQIAAANLSNDVKIYQNVWKVIREYCDASEILDMIRHSDVNGNNLLFYTINCSKEIAELTWNEIKAIYSENRNEKLTEYLKCINNNGQNIIHILGTIRDKEILRKFWTEFENHFQEQKSHDEFKKLVEQQNSSFSQNFLHHAAFCDKIEFHETLWELLGKTIKNRKELMDLVMQKDKNDNHFLQFMTTENTADIIEFTLKKLKEKLNHDDFSEFIRSKSSYGKNILQRAATALKDFKKYKILCKYVQNSCKSDEEFLEYFKEIDQKDANLAFTAAGTSTSEIFGHIMQTLEKIASREEIRNILGAPGTANLSILHTASLANKSLEAHQNLWKTFRKYFDSTEILNMIRQTDLGSNALFHAAAINTREVIDFVWDEINSVLGGNEEKMLEYLKEVNKNGENILQFLITETEKLKYFWEKLENHFNVHQFMEIVQQKSSNDSANILHFAAKCQDIEVHETLWKLLLKTFENREELKDLLIQQNKNGHDSICYLTTYASVDILKFTFYKIKENFSDNDYQEILKSKTNDNCNLLHVVAHSSTEIEMHQFLWKTFRDFCKSDQEFLEFIKEINTQNDTVFHLAANLKTNETFEFMINQLEKFGSFEEIREILRSIGSIGRNMLQIAVEGNESSDLHLFLWTIFRKYFNSTEIVNFINHCDESGDRLIHNVIRWNTKEIAELTWNQIKEQIATKGDQIEYLKNKGYDEQDLLERSLRNESAGTEVRVWVEKLMSEYGIVLKEE